jgi:hypothetical protein
MAPFAAKAHHLAEGALLLKTGCVWLKHLRNWQYQASQV